MEKNGRRKKKGGFAAVPPFQGGKYGEGIGARIVWRNPRILGGQLRKREKASVRGFKNRCRHGLPI